MTFTTTKLTELPLRSCSITLSSRSFLYSSTSKPSFRTFKIYFSSHSSLRTNRNPKPRNHNPPSKSPRLSKSHWTPRDLPLKDVPRKFSQSNGQMDALSFNRDKGQNAIDRIVLRLRNLGHGEEEEEEEVGEKEEENKVTPVTGEEKLGDLLKREWVRPDTILTENKNESDDLVLPWEREKNEIKENEGEKWMEKKRRVKAPTLAELTLEDEELRRLRTLGMFVRERISVAKAGLTKEVLQKIHDKWRKQEVVRLKFHEVLAHDMKTAHELVERRTGGLIIWRSGSVMMVYRGSSYTGPPSKSHPVNGEGDALFVPNVHSADSVTRRSGIDAISTPQKVETAVARVDQTENMTEEEKEYNSLLDGLGSRFEEWWGTGVLPVDGDVLPQKIPGYKTPFRLLPTGMRSRLTNEEMTKLRKLAKSLPCHFALGRNRNHQGLAAAILKLWEKSLVAKIAVKRGIQNTNNKLMAEEIMKLTGGVLLLRNKYFIVMFRGKDFLPTSVAAALAERQELTKQIQDVEEKARNKVVEATTLVDIEGKALAGTLAEFYEAQARWGSDVSTEEREKMMEEASKAKTARLVKRVEHKLAMAQAKKLRAQRLLAKIEASMVLAGPDYDQETIADEERAVFRRMGLRMKQYLPLGIRGVFDGVIENMHLHWKYRELVKLISKQKTLTFVEDTAKLLEYESGGILVAIERVPKGFALIYYRGKNYQRPISMRPRNLLTKAKALKRHVAMQRHEALSQHISELERTIEQMTKEIGLSQGDENEWSSVEHSRLNDVSELTQSEDEHSFIGSNEEEEDDDNMQSEDEESLYIGLDGEGDDDNDNDNDDNDNNEWDADEDFEFSSFQNHDHPLAKNG